MEGAVYGWWIDLIMKSCKHSQLPTDTFIICKRAKWQAVSLWKNFNSFKELSEKQE